MIRRPAATAAIVAAVLCVPVAAAIPTLAARERTALAEQQARDDATVAAKDAVEHILSYDYRTVDKDIARVESEATGEFAVQYKRSADQLASQAEQVRAIVQASASQPAVVAVDGDEVVVLVFVDQVSVKELSGAKTPTTRIDQSRVRLTMTRVGDRWLVSQLAAL